MAFRLTPVRLGTLGVLLLANPPASPVTPVVKFADLTPVDLHVEYTGNPIGIDASSPRLSGRLAAPESGARQTAYRVQVATSPEALSAGRNLLRDSGRLAAGHSIHVRFTDPPLAVLQGHSHANDYDDLNGIHYRTLVAMVEGSGTDNNGYAVMSMARTAR